MKIYCDIFITIMHTALPVEWVKSRHKPKGWQVNKNPKMQWIHDTVGLSHLVNYLEINLVLEFKTSLLRIGKLLQYLSCLRSNLIKHVTCFRPKNPRKKSSKKFVRLKKLSKKFVQRKNSLKKKSSKNL